MITFSVNPNVLASIKSTKGLVDELVQSLEQGTELAEYAGAAYISLVTKYHNGITLRGYAARAKRHELPDKRLVPILDEDEIATGNFAGVADVEHYDWQSVYDEAINRADTQANIEAYHDLWDRVWTYEGADIFNMMLLAMTGNVLAGQKFRGRLTEEEKVLISDIICNPQCMEVLRKEYTAHFFD